MTKIESATAEPDAWFKLDQAGSVLTLGGSWTIQQSARLDGELHHLDSSGRGPIAIDGSAIERLDSAGAWLMLRTKRALESAGRTISAFKLPERYRALVENLDNDHTAPPIVL